MGDISRKPRTRKKTVSTTAKSPVPAAKPAHDTVQVVVYPGDDRVLKVAQTYLRPTVQAALTVKAYNKSGDGSGPELAGLIAELTLQSEAVNRGELQRAEAMLVTQAHTLDAIFGNLARRAALNFGEYLNAGEVYMRLALKAQSQCRATLETLAAIKNPAPVAFVRQANIAHGPQQVNNGAAPTGNAAHAREENQNPPNKLLETQHGERLDRGAAGASSSANSQVATVGTIDRAANKAG